MTSGQTQEAASKGPRDPTHMRNPKMWGAQGGGSQCGARGGQRWSRGPQQWLSGRTQLSGPGRGMVSRELMTPRGRRETCQEGRR